MSITITQARINACKVAPYIAPLIYASPAIRSKMCPGIKTARDMKLYYNPDALESDPSESDECTLERVSRDIVRESLHILLKHGQRGQTLLGQSPSQQRLVAWEESCHRVALRETNRIFDIEQRIARLPSLPAIPSTTHLSRFFQASRVHASADDIFRYMTLPESFKGFAASVVHPRNMLPHKQDVTFNSDHQDLPHDPRPQIPDFTTKPKATKGDEKSLGMVFRDDRKEADPDSCEMGSSVTGRPAPWETFYSSEGPYQGTRASLQMKAPQDKKTDYLTSTDHTLQQIEAILNKCKEMIRKTTNAPSLKHQVTEKLGYGTTLLRALNKAIDTSVIKNSINQQRVYNGRSRIQAHLRDFSKIECAMPTNTGVCPRTSVLCDVSSSMSSKDLKAVVPVVDSVLKNLRPSGGLRFYVWNTELVAEPVKLTKSNQLPDLSTGGGTDMAAGIQALSKLTPRPQLIVVITDGGTRWNILPPVSIPVIVVYTISSNLYETNLVHCDDRYVCPPRYTTVFPPSHE